MKECWQLGTPPIRSLSSEIVEVTDGSDVAMARFRIASTSDDGTALPASWIDEKERLLPWIPTHWRAAKKGQPPQPKMADDSILI